MQGGRITGSSDCRYADGRVRPAVNQVFCPRQYLRKIKFIRVMLFTRLTIRTVPLNLPINEWLFIHTHGMAMLGSREIQRKLLHARNIVCRGYLRDDGLWDIEGQLNDVRTSDVLTREGKVLVAAGNTLHGMALRITVNGDFIIVDAQALTEHSPHAECGTISTAYAALKGIRIGPGFSAAVKARFRGSNGCTHITELIGAVATTAIQTILSTREQAGDSLEGNGLQLVDSCHAWRRGGEAFNAIEPGLE